MTSGSGVLLAIVAAALLRLPSAHPDDLRPPTSPFTARFTTLNVIEQSSVSCWTAIGNCQVGGRDINRTILFVKICTPLTSRRKPVRNAFWHVLMCIALSGNVALNPGPPSAAAVCILCDRHGRSNQIKITCDNCHSIYHSACLRFTPKERTKFKAGGYICWSCSLPNFSDSLLDLRPDEPEEVCPQNSATRNRFRSQPRLFAFNARSLNNRKRRADTLAAIENSEADIICVTETWLSADHGDNEIIPSDFIVFRKDRTNCKRASGGTLIAARHHLNPCRHKHLEVGAEIVWIEVKMGELKILLGSAYRKPDGSAAYNDRLIASLDKVAEVKHLFDACILTGDFNLEVDWQDDPPRAGNAPATDFLGAFSELALTQLIKTATRTTATTSKILDLALCDTPALISSAIVVPGTSDHDALQLEFLVQQKVPSRVREIFDFKNVDWPALSQRFCDTFENISFVGAPIERCWEIWLQKYWQILAEIVPKKRLRPRKQTCAPWMTKELRSQIGKRDKIFARWQKNKTRGAREEYLVARKQVQKALRNSRDKWMWDLGRGPGGSKFFWDFVKSKTKISPSAGVFEVNGKNISEPEQVAAAFSEVFARNFNSATNYFPFMRRRPLAPQPPSLCDMSVNSVSVCIKLKQVKGNATPGPDGVQGVVLSKCAAALAPSLARLFNSSLQQGELPAGWKKAAVAPIPKSGNKALLENYRPISMTSLVGKALEKLVRDRVEQYFEENKLIPDCQHGFRQKRSCTTLLCRTIDSWAATLDQNCGAHVHVITLDWKKAFDRVPHDRLLSKLSYYGVNGKLIKWLECFLKGRTQFVVYGGAKSEPRDVLSGVIQGSVLGPLLFNIFVADLPPAIKSELAQYADDVTLWRHVKNISDVEQLQDDLDAIFAWCAANGMELNAAKCHVLDLTRARTPLRTAYTIGGAILEYSNIERILGVHVSSDLKWNRHTEIARGKAAKVLSFAARNLQGCTPRVKRLAYLTMVKPLMFYGTPAWHPSTQVNMKKFERVQNRALRFVHGRHISEAAKKELLSVQQQLKYNDLTFFRKCRDGETNMNAMARITVGRVMRNTDGEHRLIPPKARTDLGLQSFSFRLAQQWNSLPSELKSCPAPDFPKLCKCFVMSD
ncbi:uncharacterized protein LOC132204659 [Neocloeon triangulifer]|uniref:uncharacterized protein LOC132204659 n=1 Tax=Neocloeon triangulifer TaxID=2078957 RepID=UPI00286F2702|nr:uncharacterized protein LOC132204659 [Neocloeon triangulifer]